MSVLKIKRLVGSDGEKAPLPAYATDGSAGLDLCAFISEPVIVYHKKVVRIPTGIAIELESPDYVGLVYARSGLASKHGVVPANAVGVIDSDYRGEIVVCLTNTINKTYTIKPGERIAQLVITPVAHPHIVECDALSDTSRGSGGFGSTGK